MFEMAHSGEKHCDPFLVGHFYRVFAANASAGPHNGSHSIFGGEFHSVAKRHNPPDASTSPSVMPAAFASSSAISAEPTRFICPAAYTGCRSVFHHHDGVALHMLHNLPSEVGLAEFLFSRFALSDTHVGSDILAFDVGILHEQTSVDAHILLLACLHIVHLHFEETKVFL